MVNLLRQVAQRGPAPGSAGSLVPSKLGGCDAAVDSATFARKLATIDESYDGHTADAQDLGGLLSAQQGIRWEHDRFGARLEHIDQTEQGVTSRVGQLRLGGSARLLECSLKHCTQPLCLVVCESGSHSASLRETLKTHIVFGRLGFGSSSITFRRVIEPHVNEIDDSRLTAFARAVGAARKGRERGVSAVADPTR